jgi:hypothetical protein
MQQQIELAILLRPEGPGLPVILGHVRDNAMLRTAMAKLIAQAEAGANHSNPLTARASAAQARVLRQLLEA